MEHLLGQILFVLIGIVLALGVWYFGVTRNSLKFKQLAVMIGLMPLIGISIAVAEWWFDLDHPAEFRAFIVGPANREAWSTETARLNVTNAQVAHQIEMIAKIRGGDPPTAPVHLRFRVLSPTGEVLTQGEQDLAPAAKLRWSPLRTQFQPHEEGEHSLIVEVPQPVSSVDVIVRELRK